MNTQPIARKLIGGGGGNYVRMNICFCIHVKVAIENKFIL